MAQAINRTPYNALVDDDGSNTIGTPWNKSAIAGTILDPVDASRVWTKMEAGMVGGDFSDFNPAPGIVGDTIIVIASATVSPMTIYGFKPAAPAVVGQRLIVHSMVGANIVNFYHSHPGQSVGCALNCRASPIVSITGYWAFAEFTYGGWAGVNAWDMTAYGNGI